MRTGFASALLVLVAAYPVSAQRMALQLRDSVGSRTDPGRPPRPPQDSIGALTATLQEKEAATFAGLWIEYQPEYRVVVAFTRNAAATLARYTKDPSFRPIDRAGPTSAELRAMHGRLVKEFLARGFRASMMATMENRGIVDIRLAHEAAPIRAAAARGEFPLPPWVVLIELDPLPLPAPPAPAPRDKRVKSFPQLAFRTDMYPRTMMGVPDVPATLRLIAGCLVVDTGKERRTALWQASDALDRSNPRKVVVLNRLTGIRIAAGEEVVLGGLQPSERQVPKSIVGTKGCPGPYRLIQGFMRRADWDARRRESAIIGRMQLGLDRAGATADLNKSDIGAQAQNLTGLHAGQLE